VFVVRLPAAAGVEAPEPAPGASSRRQVGGGRRVLVVDDDVPSLELASRTLADAGYAVLLATGVTDARRRLAIDRPDLAILDRRLPDGDGLVLVRELRARPATAHLPVLVLGATAAPEEAVAARAAGANGHLEKPVTGDALLASLERMMDEGAIAAAARVPAVTGA
jgi:CheY-like chemotaxis protein